MKAKERRQKIVDFVSELEDVSIEFLAEKFKVSEMTIYRDLHILEDKGYLKKTTGGAMKINDFLVHSESPFVKRLKDHNEEKRAIAKKAIEYINNGDSIIIDAGTTGFILVKEINKANFNDLTVITNNMIAQIELTKNPNIDIIAVGGTARYGSYSTVGVIAEKVLKDIIVDKAFITTKGISNDGELFDPTLNEGRIKEIFIQKARKKILIVDSSKFGIIGLYRFSNVSVFDVIITNSKIQNKNLKVLKKIDAKLEIVDV